MTPFIVRITRGIGVGVLFGAISLAGATGVAGATSVARAQPQSRALVAAPTAKVPKGFRANSITWISPERGWVLGSAPCSSPASGPAGPGCAFVIGTTNAGKTWSLTGAVKTHLVSGEHGDRKSVV